MPIYSHSRLSTFETCPLQYKLSYIDKIKREQEGIEAFLGSLFHEVMEWLYKDFKYKIHTVEELIAFYRVQWQKNWHDQIIITKKDKTQHDYYALGEKCVEDYYKRYYPFDDSKVLGLERNIRVQLDKEGKYTIQGYVDRIAQDKEGVYEIHDYKTSGFLPDQKYFDEDRQLAFYQMGVENIWNDAKKIKLIWHYVVFDKEMVSTRTQDQLGQLKKETIRLIDEIESTEEFLPRESSLCDWCIYPDLCPKRKHLYTVESLSVNEYLKDDGVKLVNTFAKLISDKKELQSKIYAIDEELDKVKEVTIKYAEKEDVDILQGSDHRLKITEKQKVSFPSKGSPERQKLEDILRDANKWDEISTLDTHAMEQSVIANRWDKKLVSKLKEFITIDVRKQVSLSKIQEKEK
jgi:putative RecB family exonuclease